MASNRFLRRVRTARHLKPSQLHYFILRRGLSSRSVDVSGSISLRDNAQLVAPISVSGIYVTETEFEFINVANDIGGHEINWQPESMSRLWQYNLHYFDFLREAERSRENKISLISSWIECNKQGSQPGWEPFTVSLRIVNWIFFFIVEMKGQPIPAHWLKSLYEQVLWLSKNDEKHILANHYFENIKAFLFASVFFKGKFSDKLLKNSQALLKQELHEQFLDDGGHYEKSPMYHSLMLENCLDLYNLFANNRTVCDAKIQALLKAQIEYSLHWLSDLQYHNGGLPLFNDSVNGLAPDYLQLSQYASRLFHYEPEASIVSGGKLIDLDASGYYGMEVGLDKFIIDCGDINPSYQPGHTHCDFLSYELCINDQMLVVDSGVYEYQEGDMRDYVRSTQAHNTVAIDKQEQSEVWAAFRVGRRAKKIDADIVQTQNGAVFTGSFEGFHSIPGRATHQRKAALSLNENRNAIKSLKIDDQVLVNGQHFAESFIHFHPSIQCIDEMNGVIQLVAYGEKIACLMINESCQYRISHAFYCPEFGKKYENVMIVVQNEGRDTIRLAYEINML